MRKNYKSAHILVVRKNNSEILLVQRSDIPFWVIPGGHLEKGETPKQAALREFREETGYIAAIDEHKAVYKSRSKKISKFLYLGHIVGGKAKINSESRSIRWFKVGGYPPGLTLNEKERIKTALSISTSPAILEYNINTLSEVINQFKNPKVFAYLLYQAVACKIVPKL